MTEALVARQDFPLLGRKIGELNITYLDSAATTLRPRAVIEAVTHYYESVGGSIHRGKNLLSEEASEMFEGVRQILADLFGGSSRQYVFTKNTTDAINLVADGLGLTSDDLVVATEDAHHSNLLPWRRRARVELAKVGANGVIDAEAYYRLLGRSPRVVALSGCSNVTGVYHAVEELAKAAQDSGALVIVDGAQSVPHQLSIPADVADFVAFSAHKMLGPSGVGVLWGRPEALAQLEPTALGGGTVDWVDLEGHRLRDIPHRLEAGTPDIASVIGFGAALHYLNGLGKQAIAVHDAELGRSLVSAVESRPGLRLVGSDPSTPRAGLVSFAITGEERLDAITQVLSDTSGVMARSGYLCAQQYVASKCRGHVLRFSTYVYTSRQDVLNGFEALDEVLGWGSSRR